MGEISKMGKKGGGGNQDALARMNFLYQASHLLVALHQENKDETKTDDQESGCLFLSRCLSNDMVKISKKTVIRMDKVVKRTICKGCSGLLISGVTSKTRFEGQRKNKLFVVSCMACGHEKRYPMTESKHARTKDDPIKDVSQEGNK